MMKSRVVYILVVIACFVGFPLTSSADDKDEALNALVMLTHVSGSDGSSFGAGFIVGSDESWIYIATAAHVVWDKDLDQALEINAEFKQMPGQVFLTEIATPINMSEDVAASTPPSIDEHEDFAVVKVSRKNLKNIAMPKIGRAYKGEKINQVQFLGRKSIQQLWRATPMFEVVEENDLQDPKRHQLIAQSFFELSGFSGGGVFDKEWRLVGMTIEGGAQSKSFAVDELTAVNRIDWIVASLKRLSIPLAPYLDEVKEGPLPAEVAMWEMPKINATLMPDQLGAKLTLITHVLRGGTIKGVDTLLFVKTKKKGWYLHDRRKIDAVYGGKVGSFLVPKDVTDLLLCNSNTLASGGSAVGMITLTGLKLPLTGYNFINQGHDEYKVHEPIYSVRAEPCFHAVESLGFKLQDGVEASSKKSTLASQSLVANTDSIPRLIKTLYVGANLVGLNPPRGFNIQASPVKILAKTSMSIRKEVEKFGYDVYLSVNNDEAIYQLVSQNNNSGILGFLQEYKVKEINTVSLCSVWRKEGHWVSVKTDYPRVKLERDKDLLSSMVFSAKFTPDIGNFIVNTASTKVEACGYKNKKIRKLTVPERKSRSRPRF